MDGAFLPVAQQCAPMIESVELAAIVSVESGFNPFAIRINTDRALQDQPKSKAEAIEIATELQIEGQDFDVGLGGLNIHALTQMGLTLSDAFDPCKNLTATGKLVASYYASARLASAENPKQLALWTFYGQGDAESGRIAGYDKLVSAKQATLEPRLGDLNISAGVSKYLPAREGIGNNPVAGVDGAAEPSTRASSDVPPDELRAEPATAAAKNDNSFTWDVFSSTRNSQAVIFR